MRAAHPEEHLLFIRSWNNATILASRAPLTPAQVSATRHFCAERGLDMCHCPGMRAEEANRYTVLEAPVYFRAAQALLSRWSPLGHEGFAAARSLADDLVSAHILERDMPVAP